MRPLVEVQAVTTSDERVMLTSEEWLEHFLDHDLDRDSLMTALVRVGRVPAVGLLADLAAEGMLTAELAAEFVGPAWSMSEYPDTHLDHDTWRGLFSLSGYTVDGVPAERPTEPLVLWRGSVPERKSDWSWTDNREVAARYAGGDHYHRPKGIVWRAVVDPHRLLCCNLEREEREYVVDTEGLTIKVDGD